MSSEEIQQPEMICPKCSHRMEVGVIADNMGPLSAKLQTWIAGVQKSTMAVFGFTGRKKTVLTFRCTKCGFLESYAP